MVAFKYILAASLATFAIASPASEPGGQNTGMAQYGKLSGSHAGEPHPSGKVSSEGHTDGKGNDTGGLWSTHGKPGTKQVRDEGCKRKSWKKAGNPAPEHHRQARADGMSHHNDAGDHPNRGSKNEHGGEHHPHVTHQARNEKGKYGEKKDNDVKHHSEYNGNSHHARDTYAAYPPSNGAAGGAGAPANGRANAGQSGKPAPGGSSADGSGNAHAEASGRPASGGEHSGGPGEGEFHGGQGYKHGSHEPQARHEEGGEHRREHQGEHKPHQARNFTKYSDYPPELKRLRQMALGNWTDTDEAEHEFHVSKRANPDPKHLGIFECKFSKWEAPCKWTPLPEMQCYKR
jgi:hypothetical protein